MYAAAVIPRDLRFDWFGPGRCKARGPWAPLVNVEPSQQGDLGFPSPELRVMSSASWGMAGGHLVRIALSPGMGQEGLSTRPKAS